MATSDSLDYSQLDPGVQRLVKVLRNNGFRTTDSGDGKTKPVEERTHGDLAHCYVTMAGNLSVYLGDEAKRMQSLLDKTNPEGKKWRVEATYLPADNICLLMAIEDYTIGFECADCDKAKTQGFSSCIYHRKI